MTTSNTIKTAIALSAMVLGQFAASAALTVTATVGGAPVAGAIKFNLNDLPVNAVNGVANSTGGTSVGTGGAQVGVSFVNPGGTAAGAVANVNAAPFLSGSNGIGFGSPDQSNGADTTTYLTTGTGQAILTFATAQKYLGLLWGSIDAYNTLSFYNGDVKVGDVTTALFPGLAVNPLGDQNVNGTKYVNIWSTLAFNKVIATSTQNAFEFDNIAIVPEPSTYIAGGLALLPLLLGLRARWNKKA